MNEIRKNDIFTIEITDLSEQGDGIGHTQEGYTLFVKDTLPGDRARVKVIKTKKNYGYARLEQLLTASPSRCEARCAVARSCGGCRLQHMRYADQLSFKENRVRELMTRIGGADDFEFLPIIGMENPWHYRNKAQYPVGVSRDGRVIAGFYAARTHSIVENDDCLIQMPQSVAVLRAVMSWMQRFHVTAYDEKTGRGLVRHVLTRIGYYTGEIMVCFVINGKKIPHAQELIDALTQMDGMTGIVLNSFLCYDLVISQGFSWQEVMAVPLLAGLAVLLLSFSGRYRWLKESLPDYLAAVIPATLGVFLIYRGLIMSHLVIAAPDQITGMGSLNDPLIWVALPSLLVIMGFLSYEKEYGLSAGLLTAVLVAVLYGLLSLLYLS